MRLDVAGIRAAPVDAIIVVAAMAAVGLFLPDYDQHLHLHRWALTHSVLPVLVTLWLRSPAVTVGMALGIAAHLSADLFPVAMRGTALIKLWPGDGIGRTATYVWLAVNVVACAAIADRLVARTGGAAARVVLLGSALALAAAYIVFNGESVLTLAATGGGFVAAQGRSVAARLIAVVRR